MTDDFESVIEGLIEQLRSEDELKHRAAILYFETCTAPTAAYVAVAVETRLRLGGDPAVSDMLRNLLRDYAAREALDHAAREAGGLNQ